MKIGVVLPIADEGAGAPTWPEIRAYAQAAETAGLDSVWVFDHLLYRFDGEPESGLHECWTIMAAAAEATERVEIGSIVLCTAFRNPAVLAKMAATLDHVSGGRLVLGLGAGWHDPEFAAFGLPTDHKVSRFDESLRVICDLIRTGRADLDGRFVTARDCTLLPPARPDLPILVAAKGPRMLDLTAAHADAWNMAWFAEPDERLAGCRADLAAALARSGRDPATLEVTVGVQVRFGEGDGGLSGSPALDGTPEAIAAGLTAHAAAGCDHAIVFLSPSTPETLATFAEGVGRFRNGA